MVILQACVNACDFICRCVCLTPNYLKVKSNPIHGIHPTHGMFGDEVFGSLCGGGRQQTHLHILYMSPSK